MKMMTNKKMKMMKKRKLLSWFMIHNNNDDDDDDDDDEPSTWMTPKTTQPFSRFCGLNQLADIMAHTHGSDAVPNQTTRGTQAVPAEVAARWKKHQQIHQKSSWTKNPKRRDRHLGKQNMQISFVCCMLKFERDSSQPAWEYPSLANGGSTTTLLLVICEANYEICSEWRPRVNETASTSFNLFRKCSTRASVTSFHSTKRDKQFEFWRKNGQRQQPQWKHITMNIDVHNRFMTVSSQKLQTSFMLSICDANRPIFHNYVQPKISPHKLASAPVLPPMHSRSGSKYAFGNQHMSNCQHVDVFIVRIYCEKVVTQHVLITSLLPVKSIWGWGTRCMSYTMNFSPPACIFSFLLETVKWKNKANHKMRVRINENFSLTWLTFKCICWWYMYNEVCN